MKFREILTVLDGLSPKDDKLLDHPREIVNAVYGVCDRFDILFDDIHMIAESAKKLSSPIDDQLAEADVRAAALAVKNVYGAARARDLIAFAGAADLKHLLESKYMWPSFIINCLGALSEAARGKIGDGDTSDLNRDTVS